MFAGYLGLAIILDSFQPYSSYQSSGWILATADRDLPPAWRRRYREFWQSSRLPFWQKIWRWWLSLWLAWKMPSWGQDRIATGCPRWCYLRANWDGRNHHVGTNTFPVYYQYYWGWQNVTANHRLHVQVTRSTAHIGLWYDMIFVMFQVLGMFVIPMANICESQRSFRTRSSIG